MTTNLPANYKTVSSAPSEENYFKRFYDKNTQVDPAKFDAVVSFFESRTKDITSARALASSLIEISASVGVDPMIILDDFKKYQENESFQAALIGLFNSTRKNTSKLGYVPARTPAPNVARNVRK